MLASSVGLVTLLIIGIAVTKADWAAPSPSPAPGVQCSSVTFTITASAQNAVYSASCNSNNETDIVSYVHSVFNGTIYPTVASQMTVQGTYTIDGTYCKPPYPVGSKQGDTLQILVHSLTYNRNYWSGGGPSPGMGFGDQYNWHTYSNLQGYHTLAIDRLGHGTNPKSIDPSGQVQAPLQIEILDNIIGIAKNNLPGNPLGRAAGISRRSHTIISTLPYRSAAAVFPQRFSDTPLGYVAITDPVQREATFFRGSYDPRIPPLDFQNEDTATTGEVAGLKTILQPVFGYTGPVFIVTGVNDALFCVPDLGECKGIQDRSAVYFPNASHFETAAIADTGHMLTLHYSSLETFAVVHDFLRRALAN